jgi:hypothetical protein
MSETIHSRPTPEQRWHWFRNITGLGAVALYAFGYGHAAAIAGLVSVGSEAMRMRKS